MIKRIEEHSQICDEDNLLKPLNLKELYGAKFKITLDEAANYQPGGKKDPWYFQIPCKYGQIYPHSDQLLGLYCVGERIRAKLHRDHPEIDVRQWSDDGEAVFLFKLDQFEMIAQYVHPRKKRRLTEERKKQLHLASLNHRFLSKKALRQSS